jgi:F0F1-type ATP synthase membrane subunit c/vacuolar-type H+-ATPase subunit K
MVFIKAVKCLSFSISLTPLVGCATGLGYVFGSFLKAVSYAPDLEDILFSNAMLGFALIESFMIVTMLIIGLIYTF